MRHLLISFALVLAAGPALAEDGYDLCDAEAEVSARFDIDACYDAVEAEELADHNEELVEADGAGGQIVDIIPDVFLRTEGAGGQIVDIIPDVFVVIEL